MEFEKLKKIIAEVLNVDEEEITMDTTFVDDLGADSLDIFQIIMGLEEEFDVEIANEEAEKIKTVGDAVEQIKQYFLSTDETDVLAYLGIGIEEHLRGEKVVRARMKFYHGENKGRELDHREIQDLALFLPHGPYRYMVERYRDSIRAS